MNLQDLRTMLDYHYWARDRLLDALETLPPDQLTRDLGSSFKSIHETIAHTYAAEWAWYSRWQGNSPTALLPADQFPDLAAVRAAWSQHEGKMRAFLDALGDDAASSVSSSTSCSAVRRAQRPSGRCCSTSSTTPATTAAR
jgi:uncharacterized damage-inducible protein DinB